MTIQTWTCQHCGKQASRQAVRGQRPKYCSRQCGKAAVALATSKPCNRCGVERTRPDVMHCRTCQAAAVEAFQVKRSQQAKLRRWAEATERLLVAAEGTVAPTVWCAVACATCSTSFLTRWWGKSTSTCCSEQCAAANLQSVRRDAKHRRRARERNAFVAKVSRAKIYARDRWRCGICDRLVAQNRVAPHPLSPTIDHIIPLSKGGSHEPSNVRLAHFICNSRRGDRETAVQLALIG